MRKIEKLGSYNNILFQLLGIKVDITFLSCQLLYLFSLNMLIMCVPLGLLFLNCLVVLSLGFV